jgi:hypothetical protein
MIREFWWLYMGYFKYGKNVSGMFDNNNYLNQFLVMREILDRYE